MKDVNFLVIFLLLFFLNLGGLRLKIDFGQKWRTVIIVNSVLSIFVIIFGIFFLKG